MRRLFLAIAFVTILVFAGCSKGNQISPVSPSGMPTPSTSETYAPSSSAPSIAPSGPAITPFGEATEAGVFSPGQIDASRIEQVVKVRGKISFINQDPGGLAIILTGGGGQVMVRVENRVLEKMTDAEKAQYTVGKTITAEGMLVRAPGGELTVVLGIIPAAVPQGPQIAAADVLTGPVKISNNPAGYRGWPWPRIFIHQGKLAVTYWGIVEGKESFWVTEQDGNVWSRPKEIPNGLPVIGGKGSYIVSSLEYTEEKGHAGVRINVLDDAFKVTKNITVDTAPADHDVDKNTKSLGVVDGKGHLHLIWERNSQKATDIYYSKFDGARLSAPALISNNPETGSTNPSIAIDSNDIVYVFWGEFSSGMYGGDVDIFYSFLKDGAWSQPVNLSQSNDWMEFMTVPWYQYANGSKVNVFYMATKGSEAGPTTHVVLQGGEVISTKKINFGFGDIALVSEEDRIHAVFGGMGPVSPGDKFTLKGEVYYNYFDGQDWYAGAGVKILPRDFYDNAETLKLDLSSIGPDKQAKVILENGNTDLLREIHPYAVFKDGVVHAVFEYNQHGTYDAYYVAFKKKSQ